MNNLKKSLIALALIGVGFTSSTLYHTHKNHSGHGIPMTHTGHTTAVDHSTHSEKDSHSGHEGHEGHGDKKCSMMTPEMKAKMEEKGKMKDGKCTMMEQKNSESSTENTDKN